MRNASFKVFNQEQKGHKKVKHIVYEDFVIQPYLTSKQFNNEERNLLYALRSSCHQAKSNFSRMNKNNLYCSLGCQTIEDQSHIFKNCPFLSNCDKYPPLEYIFGDVFEQKEALKIFLPIEKRRKQLKDTIPPGEAARTRADKAPDTSA